MPYNVARNGVLDLERYDDVANRSWVFRSVGDGHDLLFWKRFVSALRVAGYDHVLSIEHEDSLASTEEGLSRASERSGRRSSPNRRRRRGGPRPMLKLAIQSRLVPGASLREKHENALRYGFDGIELSALPDDRGGRRGDPRRRASERHVLRAPRLVHRSRSRRGPGLPRRRQAAARARRAARRAAHRGADLRADEQPAAWRHRAHARTRTRRSGVRACARRPSTPRRWAAGSSSRESTATRTACRSPWPMRSAGPREMEAPTCAPWATSST